MHMTKRAIFWLPELGWLVSFSEAKRELPSADGGHPTMSLHLCYQCADFQPYFIEVELYWKVAKAFTSVRSNLMHGGGIQLSESQRKECERFKIPKNVIAGLKDCKRPANPY